MPGETQIPLIHQETQKESSPTAGGPPVFNLGLSAEAPPSFLRETNPIPTHPSNPPTTNYEPRTTNSIMQNEPNSRTAGVSPAFRSRIARNEPNSSPFRVCHAGRRPVPMHIGEPNSSAPARLPVSAAPLSCKTNPIPVRARSRRAGMPLPRETNPISSGHHPASLTIPPIMQNEPNLPCPPPSSRPDQNPWLLFLAVAAILL